MMCYPGAKITCTHMCKDTSRYIMWSCLFANWSSSGALCRFSSEQCTCLYIHTVTMLTGTYMSLQNKSRLEQLNTWEHEIAHLPPPRPPTLVCHIVLDSSTVDWSTTCIQVMYRCGFESLLHPSPLYSLAPPPLSPPTTPLVPGLNNSWKDPRTRIHRQCCEDYCSGCT